MGVGKREGMGHGRGMGMPGMMKGMVRGIEMEVKRWKGKGKY